MKGGGILRVPETDVGLPRSKHGQRGPPTDQRLIIPAPRRAAQRRSAQDFVGLPAPVQTDELPDSLSMTHSWHTPPVGSEGVTSPEAPPGRGHPVKELPSVAASTRTEPPK